MTREEILAMEPGLHIDIAVRREVMGLEYTTGVGGLGLPHYSTDIKDAWQVLEKTGLLSTDNVLHFAYGEWCVSENDYGDLHAIASCKSAPEAICKAALLDVMTKEKPRDGG